MFCDLQQRSYSDSRVQQMYHLGSGCDSFQLKPATPSGLVWIGLAPFINPCFFCALYQSNFSSFKELFIPDSKSGSRPIEAHLAPDQTPHRSEADLINGAGTRLCCCGPRTTAKLYLHRLSCGEREAGLAWDQSRVERLELLRLSLRGGLQSTDSGDLSGQRSVGSIARAVVL